MVLWEALQANSELSYRDEPEASLSVGDREDVARFGVFCELSGLVLDVGCGRRRCPRTQGANTSSASTRCAARTSANSTSCRVSENISRSDHERLTT